MLNVKAFMCIYEAIYGVCVAQWFVWLSGLVVSTLGIRTRGPRFGSWAPLFHSVATFNKLFTHIASPVSQLQETVVQKGVFGA